MTPLFNKQGVVLISIITAVAMLATAYLAKGSEYENAWLMVLVVGSLLSAAFEVYSKKI